MTRNDAIYQFKRYYPTIWTTYDVPEVKFAWDIFKEDLFRDELITMREKIVWECPKKEE